MKNLIITAKFLKRQFLLNTVIIVVVLLSVIMLTEVYVYISDRMDNQRAAEELYNDRLLVLEEFAHYHAYKEDLIAELKSDHSIERVGRARVGVCTSDGRTVMLGLYNTDLIEICCPGLSEGEWLPPTGGEPGACPAVVSSDMGLSVGAVYEVSVEEGYTLKIRVVGILATPTQYLLPTGMSDSVASLISQEPVILISDTELPGRLQRSIPDGSGIETLFILTDMTAEQFASKYNKYGSIRSINEMIGHFTESYDDLIAAEVLLFVLFFLLATIVILCTEVVHSRSCRKSYTIYYMLGMRREDCLRIESLRHIVLIILIMGTSVLMDRYGLLQTTWMSDKRRVLSFAILALYLIAIFFGTSAAFMRSLLTNDISVSLKALNGEE